MKELAHNALAVTKVLFARMRFLSVFLIAGLVVGYWDNIKNHVDKWTRPAIAPDALAHAHDSDIEYYCAMHPNVIREQPGNCPICSMPLIKRKKGEHVDLPADVLSRVQLSPQRIAMANIATTLVEYRPLHRMISAIGVVDYDQTRLAQLSARVPGRADRLFLQSVGQPVKKGQVVYSIYSPEVYTAIRDYLTARKRVNELMHEKKSDMQADAGDVYNASMQRLLLWGVTRQQLDAFDTAFDKDGTVLTQLDITSPIDGIVVEKNILEGGYLETGSVPFTIADLSVLWLKVKVYETDIPQVLVGQEAHVNVQSMPGQQFDGRITYLDFKIDPQTRTLDARVEVKNPEGKLRPGMFADAILESPITQQTLEGRGATLPTTAPASDHADDFAAALSPYMEAQKKLAGDSAEHVVHLLASSASRLASLKNDPQLKPLVERYELAIAQTQGKDIAGIREAFKEISASLIEIGKAARIPVDSPAISVYRCPMAKANWLQPVGTTSNPYYGSAMPTCGGPVEALPRAEVIVKSPTTQPAGRVLVIPRTAVIDTGKRKIVYLQSSEGVYDMKEVKLGSPAGEFYPVISGLNEADQVVTRGAFLIDAENRLNPVGTP